MVDAPEPILRGRNVLVVEDEFLIALDVQRLIEEAGAAEVHLANSIDRARQLLDADKSFHLAIVDRRLGGKDTAELIAHLCALKIPLLVATGLQPERLPPGAAIVRKPFRDEELLAAIAELLGG